MEIRGTDFVLFPVSDLPTAARFYREILGLPQEIYSEADNWAEFNCGNVTLSLHGGADAAELGGGARLALATADIDTSFRELRARGVIVSPPEDHGVCRHIEVRDPDGHVVILHQRADGSFGQLSPTI